MGKQGIELLCILYFFDQMPQLLFFFCCLFCAATIRGWLLIEGGVYFFGKPGDINDGWIRYIRVRR